jgi:hypothetical protein
MDLQCSNSYMEKAGPERAASFPQQSDWLEVERDLSRDRPLPNLVRTTEQGIGPAQR